MYWRAVQVTWSTNSIAEKGYQFALQTCMIPICNCRTAKLIGQKAQDWTQRFGQVSTCVFESCAERSCSSRRASRGRGAVQDLVIRWHVTAASRHLSSLHLHTLLTLSHMCHDFHPLCWPAHLQPQTCDALTLGLACRHDSRAYISDKQTSSSILQNFASFSL